MCGIAGVLVINGRHRDPDPAAAALRMVDTLAHRGPDGSDSWGDPQIGIGLGHRRLAVVDLSETGRQPMISADGRYVIVFNGEVYNFQDLRAELENRKHRFRGTSDTEVMLAAFLEWGPEKAINRFVGMFAFALFDRQTHTLRLVRDRLGVKPLYWAVADGILIFGSELRALMAHPGFRKEVNREAIAAVVQYSYVPAPATVFQNVFKLLPGTILTVQPGTEPRVAPYWQLLDHIGQRAETKMDFKEATDRFHELLREAVSQRMVADVPIGAFLSGGTDSSAVVALMQAVSKNPVRTFTVGFHDSAYDESALAKTVAQHLGTDHTEFDLDPKSALDLVNQIPEWFDEPFADSSQLPTYLVARMTRLHVTVALSGDGGDELFAGYPKYDLLNRVWSSAGKLPHMLRRPIGAMLGGMAEGFVNRIGSAFLDSARSERFGEKMRRLGDALAARTFDRAVLAVASVGLSDGKLVNGASSALQLETIAGLERLMPDFISRMQIYDTLTYLPDDILTKVDRCSMAVSLEAREPLLDHRLVEFVWSLPVDVRRGGLAPKALVRAVLERYLPPHMIDRPKRGFSVPLAQWLAGPLRPWAEDLLSPAKLAADGMFDASRVRGIWDKQMAGTENNATGLWNILMVCAWSRRWLAP